MKQGRKPFVYSEMGERFSGEREWRGTRQTFPIPLNKTKPEGKTACLSRWFVPVVSRGLSPWFPVV